MYDLSIVFNFNVSINWKQAAIAQEVPGETR